MVTRFIYLLLLFFVWHCIPTKKEIQYTCPMAEDSVFSNKPGNCPKCGMKLVLMKTEKEKLKRDEPSKNEKTQHAWMVPMSEKKQIEISAVGQIEYNEQTKKSVSLRVSGRIEKSYITQNFQHVQAGDVLLDVYSPELNQLQQNLLTLMQDGSVSPSLLNEAKQALLVKGMSPKQLNTVIKNKKIATTIHLVCPYDGHIHAESNNAMKESIFLEGKYVEEGENLFSVYATQTMWLTLNVPSEYAEYLHVGNEIRWEKEKARVEFIYPATQENESWIKVRTTISHDGAKAEQKISATLLAETPVTMWLPETAVFTTGMHHAVMIKKNNEPTWKKIDVGITVHGFTEVKNGLTKQDSVARDVRYFLDSESFMVDENL